MMISPDTFRNEYKDATYEELIIERNRLFHEIQEFERLEKSGDRSGTEWMSMPSPDTIYQMNLEYLSVLCDFMQQRYNEE